MVLSMLWTIVTILVVIIIIIILLKVVFAIIAIGPIAIQQQHRDLYIISNMLVQSPLH